MSEKIYYSNEIVTKEEGNELDKILEKWTKLEDKLDALIPEEILEKIPGDWISGGQDEKIFQFLEENQIEISEEMTKLRSEIEKLKDEYHNLELEFTKRQKEKDEKSKKISEKLIPLQEKVREISALFSRL